MNISQYVILAGLVYTVLEFVKPVYDPAQHKWSFDRIAALVLGVLISLGTGFDLLTGSGVVFQLPYVGQVLTGILVGGSVGAGLIHDFPDFLKALFGVSVTPPTTGVG